MINHLKIFIFLMIMSSGCLKGYAQDQTPVANLPVDKDSKKILYRGVVDQQGSLAYLYNKAIEWFGYYYVNPQSVYSVQDKENGRIEGNGRMRIYYTEDKTGVRRDAGLVLYQIKLEIRENKFRYTVTDFNLKAASRFPIEQWLNKSDPAYNSKWDSYLYQIDTTMQRMVSTLKEKMKPTVVKKDEW